VQGLSGELKQVLIFFVVVVVTFRFFKTFFVIIENPDECA
jgi:uncharacterized membrane protein